MLLGHLQAFKIIIYYLGDFETKSMNCSINLIMYLPPLRFKFQSFDMVAS